MYEAGLMERKEHDEIKNINQDLAKMLQSKDIQKANIGISSFIKSEETLNKKDQGLGNPLLHKLSQQISQNTNNQVNEELHKLYDKVKLLEKQSVEIFMNDSKKRELAKHKKQLKEMLKNEKWQYREQISSLQHQQTILDKQAQKSETVILRRQSNIAKREFSKLELLAKQIQNEKSLAKIQNQHQTQNNDVIVADEEKNKISLEEQSRSQVKLLELVNQNQIKPLYKDFKVDKYKFHNPALVKADLRSSFEYIANSKDNQKKSPNESGIIFMEYSNNDGHHIMRQRLVRDFTSIERMGALSSKQIMTRQGFKVSGVGGIIENPANRGIHKYDKKGRYIHLLKKHNREDIQFIRVTKEFLIFDEDVQFNTVSQNNINFYDNLDSSLISRQGGNLSPREGGAIVHTGSQSKLKAPHQNAQDTFDEDSSFRENKDQSYAEVTVSQPNQAANRESSHLFENTRFYEEPLDEESYDHELIEELFNPKKKVRIVKQEHAKSINYLSRMTTDGYEKTETMNSNNNIMNSRRLGRQQNRDSSPLDTHFNDDVDRKKSRHRSSKRKIDLSNIIEYFDPIQKKKALSKKTMSNKKKDKGSTQKHGVINKRVPADNSTQEEHGQINFYGNVNKQRFKYNQFHLRWVVLRGFNLYWYRSALDRQQKGMITLPSTPIQLCKVGQNKCFQIMKEDGASQSRTLKFLDNEQNSEFKCKISNSIYYKMYLESSQRKNQKLDINIVFFFNNQNMNILEFKDKNLNEEHKILHIFEAMSAHHRLMSLSLINCGLSDDSLDLLLFKLRSYPNQIYHLDLSQNDFTQHSMPSLCQDYLRDINFWKTDLVLQLKFSFLFNILDFKIRNFQTIDYDNHIDLDISKNSLTETSLKYLADILKKFQGFKSINMRELSKMKDIGYIEMFRAFKDNYSLISIDLSKNSLSATVIGELLQAIAENFVISEVIIDIKGKSLPSGFSTNTLMSMFQVYISREAVYL
ncbi:UNKNOWN [Stylonychia lemnae]|uniref:Uncharacterized protein n=1 Tax=Stylonychia lemnae TaxID=5949 RepID=A0A078B981_STYLE|nr:UNKNOWN [Stylonychia lemnae]|eukprot:CDW90123.1 UNKNOWN [Stylonychia lemnae]